MKVEIEELGDLKIRLTVEVDAESFQQKKKVLARSYAPHVTMKGFRPGKAPLEMVMRQIGPALDGEVREDIIKTSFAEALEERSLKPSVEPQVEIKEAGEDGSFSYTAEFECMPSIDPVDYMGVEVAEPTLPEIKDEDVEAGLERMQQAAATWEAKDGDSVGHENDMAVCRLVIKDAGTDEVIKEEDDRRLVVGMADYPVADMGRELLGMKAGEEKTLKGTFNEGPMAALEDGGEEAGPREAVVTVEVKNLSAKKVPDLDEEFAKHYGGGVSLDEWRAKVRGQLETGRERSLKEIKEDSVVEAILEKNQMELGQATVDRLAKAAEDAAKARMLPTMSQEERDKVDLGLPRDETEAQARRNLSRQILLQSIADKEGVEVSEEDFDTKLEEMSAEMGIPVPKLKARLGGDEGEQMRTRMRLEKTLDMLVRYAVVKAETGEEAGDDTASKEEEAPVEAAKDEGELDSEA